MSTAMTGALASDSGAVALDLHELLLELDPVRFRSARDLFPRLAEIQTRITQLLEIKPSVAVEAVRAQLYALSTVLAACAPNVDAAGAELRAQWQTFRLKVQPEYEALAASLSALDIHVPSLRPTNRFRSGFHLLSGLAVVGIIEVLLPQSWLTPVAGSFAVTAWVFELSRRYSPAWNRVLMWLFAHVAHPHENHRINSSTWYVSALLLLSLSSDAMACAVACAVLAVADPAAATIGRRWGKTKLVNGRSLQGTTAFVITGTLAAWAVLELFHPELSGWRTPLLALCAALPAGLAELFSRRLDDNFSIPMTAAMGLWVGVWMFG